MPLPLPTPPAITQPAPSSPAEEIILPANDAMSGHQSAMAEAAKKWPEEVIHVTSEGLDDSGLFHMTFSHKPSSETHDGGHSPEEPLSENDGGIKTPKAVIFLSGDRQGFGAMPSAPPSPGRPVIVATKGDGEDHLIMDARWKDALNGQGLLWTQRLSWKYRTQTVVFRNILDGHAILEQGGSAVDCGVTVDDPRKAVEQCLNDDAESVPSEDKTNPDASP